MRRNCFIRCAQAALLLSALLTLEACASKFEKTVSALPKPRTEAGLELTEFDSELLGKKMAVYVYLPPGYRTDKTYPVVYLLHGYSNNEIEWFDYHHLNAVADRLIAEGKIEPVVIVAPRMDNSWGIDSGKPQMLGPTPRRALYNGPYETYFLKEVMYLVESRYNVSKNAEGRSIGGISMGGFAALHIGFRHPELFAKIGAHSAALAGTQIPEFFLYTKEQKRSEYDPLELAKTSKLDGNKIFIDCGEQDGFFAGDTKLRDILTGRNLKVTFYSAPGAHTAAYWHPNLERYLLFYAGK